MSKQEMSTTGTRQIVVLESEDRISSRLLVEGKEKTLTLAGVTIYNPGGTKIVDGASATTSGSLATFNTTWITANYPIGEGYKASWILEWTDGTGYSKIVLGYFDVVLRRFDSLLSDSDLTYLHPYIALPAGVPDYSSFRLNAWRRIERIIRARFSTYPGNLFYQGDLFDIHLHLSLSGYFMANSFESAGSEDWDKSRHFEQLGMEELETVLSNVAVDVNNPPDGLLTEGEKHFYLGGVELIR